MFHISFFRTRYQRLGLHQKKASNVCQKTREDQGSSENDERCEFKFVFGNSSNVPDLKKEEPPEWPEEPPAWLQRAAVMARWSHGCWSQPVWELALAPSVLGE